MKSKIANRKSAISAPLPTLPKHLWTRLTTILARMSVLERKLASIERKERTP